jgi:hypothetical protein
VSRIEATKEQLAELAEMRRDGPVTMINLLAFEAPRGAERWPFTPTARGRSREPS